MADGKQHEGCPLGITPLKLGTRLGNIETTGEIIVKAVEKLNTKMDNQNGRIGGLEKADVAHNSRITTLEDRPGPVTVKQAGVIGGALTTIWGGLLWLKGYLSG